MGDDRQYGKQKMAHDTEDELQDAAQDRQDAISEGCIEEFAKTNPVEVRGGSVEGPLRVRPGGMRGPALDFV